MEKKYNLKNVKSKKGIKGILILALMLFTISISLYPIKKENKGIETIDESWGLGKKVTESISNNRDYEWYVDQLTTGSQAHINCGPTSIEMASKWKNKNSTLKAQDIRKNYLNDGYGADISVVCKVFDENNIKYKELCNCNNIFIAKGNDAFLKDLPEEKKQEARYNYSTSYYATKDEMDKVKEDIKEEVKSGNVVLTAIYTRAITLTTNDKKRCGRYHSFDGSHWIIVKGYKVVDDKLYFEVYDSYGGDFKYEDGTLMAKDRYYLADEIMNGYFYSVSVIK